MPSPLGIGGGNTWKPQVAGHASLQLQLTKAARRLLSLATRRAAQLGMPHGNQLPFEDADI